MSVSEYETFQGLFGSIAPGQETVRRVIVSEGTCFLLFIIIRRF